MQREAKEAARLQQMQDKELKRRSWAGGEEVRGHRITLKNTDTPSPGPLMDLLCPNPSQVRGAVGLRCSSETDMSTVVAKDDAGLLTALLTPKSPRRSSPKSDHITRGRSLRSQRTRNPPSSTPLFAAERELSTYFKLSKERKVPQQRGKGDSRTSASPKSEPTSTGTSTKADPQTIPLPSKTSSDSTDVQTQGTEVKSTSCSNQHSDHNNNENSQRGVSLSSQENLQTHENIERSVAPEGNVSALLEKCPLGPELKAFEEDVHHQRDQTIITDVHEEVVDNSQIPNLQNNSKDGEESNVEVPAARSPSQRQDSEEQEDKVMVWCVTGVCEPTSEHVQMEKHQFGRENQRASSPSPNQMSSEPSLDSDKSASVPISSQPVSRGNDSSLLVSSPGLHPAEPAPTSPGPGLTVDASEDDNVSVSQTRNEKANAAPVSEQTTDFKNKTTSRCLTEKASSVDGKAKLATSSKQPAKSFHTSKPQNTLMKPSTPNSSTSVASVRALTSSENVSMRRVVPITNTSRGATAVAKHPEKPAAHSQSSFRTAVPTIQPNASIRQGERPSTTPSRRSSDKMPESKGLRNQKVSGVQATARAQNSGVQRKPSIRTKPKAQTDEKLCLIKLRALAQGEGGGSVSAPVTPLHKNKTSSSSVLPGFAQNTASSSFRRTKTSLATSLSHTGSPKPPLKTSSLSPSNASSAVSHTGSLTTSSRSASPLRTSQNIRSSTRSSLPNSLVLLGRDHQRDNGSVSDKSTQFRESSKTTRPNWR